MEERCITPVANLLWSAVCCSPSQCCYPVQALFNLINFYVQIPLFVTSVDFQIEEENFFCSVYLKVKGVNSIDAPKQHVSNTTCLFESEYVRYVRFYLQQNMLLTNK